ncbi:hypothetical protein HQ45_00515 [Porphyromonas crevioricanis]|uniref:Lipoprotein n=1 Tax=Porphyromonas crevioricanis TaxID=393921 RepID=A0A0A2FJN4_9PORP|nr:hypothetical protein [Porphyromonas crevioricanis]KGN91296.1 hypothetical protein HQ45_00515 [Porphyromonas crevioricanis]GAD07520.1 hypothetical protein PORCAN_1141 [Porphyromonas crevioricanis JCM 13913]SQH72979.1 Uncharacterised protein [Porphyromonas crevioricanis]
MNAKIIKLFGWLLIFTLGTIACKKSDEPNKPDDPIVIDPYTPVTEGRVFMPVLMNKPDMDKVTEVEKSRSGSLVEKLAPNPDEGKNYILYKFEYREMDIRQVHYQIHPKTGVLLKVIMQFPSKKSTLLNCLALISKQGFNDDHILAQRYSALAREKDALFTMHYKKEGGGTMKIMFDQYGKQPSALPTIPKLPSEEYDIVLEDRFFSFGRIKGAEKNLGNTLKATIEEESGKHKGKVKYAIFSLKAEEAPMTHRGYFFDWEEDTAPDKLGLCCEILFFYKHPSLGYYVDDIRKKTIPTREFYDLCKKNGCEWLEECPDGDFFINKKKKVVLVARKIQFDDISPNDILAINIFKSNDMYEESKGMRAKGYSSPVIENKSDANKNLRISESSQAVSSL